MTDSNADGYVSCPICLSLLVWKDLAKYRWDSARYVDLEIPDGLSPDQLRRIERGAYVKCPSPASVAGEEHYLPADYGKHGKPIVVGFVGRTESGKSHLLASMVGAIEGGGLSPYGISHNPVDLALHRRFMGTYVKPLLDDHEVLDGTKEGLVSFVDAYLMDSGDGEKRPIALFDVSGNDFVQDPEAKQFLDIADGLIFVIDPAQIRTGTSGDETFSNVANLLGDRFAQVSSAVVLNKADLVRFDDPIATWWFRPDVEPLDAGLIMRESADVYAYLHSQGAGAWVAPFSKSAKVTLHIASATGGPATGSTDGIYPRGVWPHRVLTPLVALLAMTGVIKGTQAEKVGI